MSIMQCIKIRDKLLKKFNLWRLIFFINFNISLVNLKIRNQNGALVGFGGTGFFQKKLSCIFLKGSTNVKKLFIVCLGLGLMACSENYKQQASSLSISNFQITEGVLKVYAFSTGKRGELLESFFIKDGKSNFKDLDFSQDYLLLELSEFSYVDPLTEKSISMNGNRSWLTLIQPTYENSSKFVINPITTLATSYVEILVKKGQSRDEALSLANDNFQSHFGGISIWETEGLPLNDGPLNDERLYQLALVGFSNLASQINPFTNLNYTSRELLMDLLNDIKDGYFDGKISSAEDVEVQGYLFDPFVFNHKLSDALSSYLVSSDLSYKNASQVQTLKNTLKDLDRSFFKNLPSNDNQGPEILLVKPVANKPVGNGFPILINFTDASGPLSEVHVFYDNQEMTDTNPSSFIFSGVINNVGMTDGSKEFRVEATDSKGNITTKIIQVISDNTLPVLNFLVDGNLPTPAFYMAGVVDLEATLMDNNLVGDIEIWSSLPAFNALIHDNDPEDGVFHTVIDTMQITTNTVDMVLHVRGTDYAGNEVQQDYNVTIYNRGPVISIEYPLEGKTFHNGDTIVAHATSLTGSVATLTGAMIDNGVMGFLNDSDVTVPGFSHLVNFTGADDNWVLRFEATDDKGILAVKEIQVEYNENFFQFHRTTGLNVPDISMNMLFVNTYFSKRNLTVGKSVQGSSLYSAYLRANPSFQSFPINVFDTGNFSLPPMILPWFPTAPVNFLVASSDHSKNRTCNINNDAYDDEIYHAYHYNPTSNAFFVHLGPQDTNGQWAIDFAVQATSGNTDIHNLVCFDFNEDGYDDVLAFSTIYFGPNLSTTANFNTVTGLDSADFYLGVQRIGDVDGDSHQDYLLLYQESTNGNNYFLPIYGPVTGAAATLGVSIPTTLSLATNGVLQDDAMSASNALGDINGDGLDDFAIAKTVLISGSDNGGSFDLYYGKTSRTSAWTKTTKNQMGSPVYYNSFFQTCDVDGNGFIDLIFRDYDSTTDKVAIGMLLGPGYTQSRNWETDFNATVDLICKDINNDGKGDIVVVTTDREIWNTNYNAQAGYIEVLHD
jgi:hypothetical protein